MLNADCLIPAAGESSRMGAWKQALPLGDTTMVQHVVAAASQYSHRVIVVGGCQFELLADLVGSMPKVVLVENPEWKLGMFSSIQRGLHEVATQRFFICLADLPLITPDVFKALLTAPETDVVAPTFNGRHGHPVLLSRKVAETAMAADPEKTSMRDIIGNFLRHDVQWRDNTIHLDADTPEEFRLLSKKISHGG